MLFLSHWKLMLTDPQHRIIVLERSCSGNISPNPLIPPWLKMSRLRCRRWGESLQWVGYKSWWDFVLITAIDQKWGQRGREKKERQHWKLNNLSTHPILLSSKSCFWFWMMRWISYSWEGHENRLFFCWMKYWIGVCLYPGSVVLKGTTCIQPSALNGKCSRASLLFLSEV